MPACVNAAVFALHNLQLPNGAAVAAAEAWGEQTTSATSATAAFESNQVGPFRALLAASVGSGLLAC